MATRAGWRIGGDVHSAMMSSKAQDWRTPPALFAERKKGGDFKQWRSLDARFKEAS